MHYYLHALVHLREMHYGGGALFYCTHLRQANFYPLGSDTKQPEESLHRAVMQI